MRTLLEGVKQVLISGHRGCVCQYKENSIAAMEGGLRQGVDYLEIDIQPTRDLIPVVYHDVRLEKKTALTGYVHEHTLEELQAAVLGLYTLAEAMERGCSHDACFGLELKTVSLRIQAVDLKLVELMLPMIEQSGVSGQVFLFGQDYQAPHRVKQLSSGTETGLIVPFVPEDLVALMRSMDALVYLSYVYNMVPKITRRLKENGYYVNGTILREEQWKQAAMELRVTMFESDEPGRIVKKWRQDREKQERGRLQYRDL